MTRYETIRFPSQIRKEFLAIRSQAENLFNDRKNKYQFICHKGCADCCVVFPWFLIEAAYICYQFNQNSSLIDLNIFTKRIDDLDKIFEERKSILTDAKSPFLRLRSSEEASYFYDILADQQCPFLDQDKSCIIYNFRPIMCVMFGSLDKNLCKTSLEDRNFPFKDKSYEYHFRKIERKLESLSKNFLRQFNSKLLRFKPKLSLHINRWIEVKDGKFLLCLPGVRLEILP